MKDLVKILIIGLLVFMALALVQERQVFLSTWFGGDVQPAPEVAEDDRRAAEDTVSNMLSMMRHLYSSDGDPRFAERMPAGQVVIDELMEDITYLRRNHRRQDPRLMRLVVDEVTVAGSGRLRVRTTEHWVIRILWIDGNTEAERPHSMIVHGVYRLARDTAGWKVMWWDSDGGESGEVDQLLAPPAESGEKG